MSNAKFTISATTGMWALSSLLLMNGCASSQPAPQLTEAQRTYHTAAQGKASQYAPDLLLESKKTLVKAEEASNGSKKQVHLAYLADRQARLATSNGSIEYYQEEATRAQASYISGLEQKSQSANEQLNQQESKLSATNAALSDSERARRDAEIQAQAALASLNKLAQVKEEANETVITLSGSVLFETGKTQLLPIAENSLDKVAHAIKTMGDEKQIVVEGHTDDRGAPEMNKKLSQERAESVLNYLAQQGVEKSRMTADGKGESDPIANNDSPEGRANNRRVELHISNRAKDTSEKTGSTSPSADGAIGAVGSR